MSHNRYHTHARYLKHVRYMQTCYYTSKTNHTVPCKKRNVPFTYHKHIKVITDIIHMLDILNMSDIINM